MNTRRQVLGHVVAGLAALSLPALAQQERRVRRLGYLSAGSAESNAPWVAAFRQGMAELRWVEGRDYVLDERYASGVSQALAGLAAELVATQPDLLLAAADGSIGPLVQRTKTIPIVSGVASDPVRLGYAASLQRPGGNFTGLTTLSRDLAAKRLQLLKEAFPRIAHVVVLFEPDTPNSFAQVNEIEQAAPRLKMRVTPIEVRKGADIEPVFKRGAALGAHAYYLATGYLMLTHRQAIADLILRSKVPAIYSTSEFVEANGLMSYGPSSRDNYRRAAGYVDKILKGAKPGELPIEQPVMYELVVNMKTAKALGIKIPQSLLLRADRVIE